MTAPWLEAGLNRVVPRGSRILVALVLSTVAIGASILLFPVDAPLVTLLVPLVVSSLMLGPRQLPYFVLFVLLVLAVVVPFQDEITVRVVLGRGAAADTVWTCDFSHDYVTINADYRS